MEKYDKLIDFHARYQNTVIALGMFDGLHIGHQKIIYETVHKAREINGVSIVFSFLNHPLSVINPQKIPQRLGDSILRQRILTNLGVDILVEIPFTEDFADTSANDFIDLLHMCFSPQYIVVGENYTFGRRGKGTVSLLYEKSTIYEFRMIVCSPVMCDEIIVSSTRIRNLLQNGNITQANKFLGYPFSILGCVVHGEARGRQLGFPTANISLPHMWNLLPNGVYAVTVVYQRQLYKGVANIGNNPTFEGTERRLEVHIFNFSKEIYGEEIMVSFYIHIRNEQKFSSISSLTIQMKHDQKMSMELLEKFLHLQENISMII